MNAVSRQAGYDSGNVNAYSIKSGGTQNLYSGQIVRVSSGYLKALSTNTQTPVGVFSQALYNDPVTGRPTWAAYIPSGTSSGGEAPLDGVPINSDNPGLVGYVYDDPNAVFVIQANTTVTRSQDGAFAQVSLNTTGSSFSKRANTQLDISAAGTSLTNAVLKVVGCPNFPYTVDYGVSVGQTSDGALINQWGVKNTYVAVTFARHRFAPGGS